MKKLTLNLLSMVMVLVILLGSIAVLPQYSVAYANTGEIDRINGDIDDLNNQIKELEEEQKALQEKIDNAKDELAQQEAIKDKAEKDIAIVQEQIRLLNEKITMIEESILHQEAAIDNLSADIARNYQLFKDRLRASYMNRSSLSLLGMLLGADDFSDYLAQDEIIKSMAEYDTQLIADLSADKAEEEHLKSELEADYAELEATKAAAVYKDAELDRLLAATEDIIYDVQQQEKEFLADQEAISKQLISARAEIDDLYDLLEWTEAQFSGKEFILPVPGYSNISSYYGWRFNNTDYHTGIDFSGVNIYRKSVVASNDGVVNYVMTSYTPGWGYGKYIIIDHGGGYSTLYAHLDSISVKKGDEVDQGDTIGKVGSTGWSTGPHLHFEIREYGAHQNPYSYLFG